MVITASDYGRKLTFHRCVTVDTDRVRPLAFGKRLHDGEFSISLHFDVRRTVAAIVITCTANVRRNFVNDPIDCHETISLRSRS